MIEDIVGRKYGMLTAVRFIEKTRGNQIWECLCECGTIKRVRKCHFVNGLTVSCGCLKRMKGNPKKLKHGMADTAVYRVWYSMKERCLSTKNKSFAGYGGRGITICPEWSVFAVFYADMGDRPFKGAQIDRVDNSKGYSKDNCRWSTQSENCRNRRSNRKITVNGVTRLLVEWAEISGLHRTTISCRLRKGATPEEAICNSNQRQ
jgi:hypothetical protein